MRKRVLLLAAPLCVVAIAASVAVASPSDAEHSRGPKLDKLHAERPTAAASRTASIGAVTKAEFDRQAIAIQEYAKAEAFRTWITGLIVGDYIVSVQQAEAQAAAPRQVSSSVSSNSNPGDFLSCVRNRESGGNYGVYNSGGSGAAGAYQFMPGTWNGIASSTGRSDLVGLDPAQAAPADQDAMAQALYAQQGAAPWGGGC
jgi:Transglycosylase-like domain